MIILLLGATGATGRLLLHKLLDRGHEVRVVVRSPEKLPGGVTNRPGLTVIRGTVLDMAAGELLGHVRGCAALASCLGHELNLRGIFGEPRRLVTESVQRVCEAALASGPSVPVKFVLMNTAGNSNRDLREPVSFPQRAVIGLLRRFLPPHRDNEMAADYLRLESRTWGGRIGWVVVRPDTLTDEPAVTPYNVHPSPVTSALFAPGRTSRLNVARFMADLITDEAVWGRWRGSMPVVYDGITDNG
jgi:nucleoside-diphosphate-sugar epimerase